MVCQEEVDFTQNKVGLPIVQKTHFIVLEDLTGLFTGRSMRLFVYLKKVRTFFGQFVFD